MKDLSRKTHKRVSINNGVHYLKELWKIHSTVQKKTHPIDNNNDNELFQKIHKSSRSNDKPQKMKWTFTVLWFANFCRFKKQNKMIWTSRSRLWTRAGIEDKGINKKSVPETKRQKVSLWIWRVKCSRERNRRVCWSICWKSRNGGMKF